MGPKIEDARAGLRPSYWRRKIVPGAADVGLVACASVTPGSIVGMRQKMFRVRLFKKRKIMEMKQPFNF